MTAADRNNRKTIEQFRNTARQSSSFIPPCVTPLHRPSLSSLQARMLNRTAVRSARAKAAHAARREYEFAIFGRPATPKERGVIRHMKSYIKNILGPECKAEGIDVALVLDRIIETLNTP